LASEPVPDRPVKTWLQVEFDTVEPLLQRVEDALQELGALAISCADAGDQPILEPLAGETPVWSRLRISALLHADADRDAIGHRLAEATESRHPPKIRFSILQDRDWHAAWVAELAPIPIGQRLWICPTDAACAAPEAAVVRLAPGLAFGTGTHPTTAMCLEWLEEISPSGLSVLDYGCGSGILGIAAMVLGARRAACIDIDPQALEACRQNARKNACADRLSIGRPEDLPRQWRFDVLVANILSEPLIRLAPLLRDHCTDGARIALSGILETQARRVCAAFAEWAEIEVSRQQDDWVLLTGTATR